MLNSDVVISVVVPVYNHAQYVEATLRSILAQTWEAIELIVINDGSTDSSSEVVSAFLKEHQHSLASVKFIDRPNKGMVKTLNEGIGVSQGKYIAVIASDDIYEPNALKVLGGFLEQNSDYVLAVGDNRLMDDEGRKCFWGKKKNNVYTESEAKFKTFGDFLKSSRPEIDFSTIDFGSYESLLRGNYVPNGYVFSRKAFESFGGYDDRSLIDDHNLMLNMAKCGRIKFIDDVLFSYRWHAKNTIKTLSKERCLMQSVLKLEKDYSESNLEYWKIWKEEWSNSQERTGLSKTLWRWKKSIWKRLKR